MNVKNSLKLKQEFWFNLLWVVFFLFAGMLFKGERHDV